MKRIFGLGISLILLLQFVLLCAVPARQAADSLAFAAAVSDYFNLCSSPVHALNKQVTSENPLAEQLSRRDPQSQERQNTPFLSFLPPAAQKLQTSLRSTAHFVSLPVICQYLPADRIVKHVLRSPPGFSGLISLILLCYLVILAISNLPYPVYSYRYTRSPAFTFKAGFFIAEERFLP